MSLIFNSPILSLTPIVDSIYDPVSFIPITTQLLIDDTRVLYDPFRTFSLYFPTVPVYYVDQPDLNTDVNVQKKVFNKLWTKLEEKWIFEFVKIFKFISGSKGNYKLVSSLVESENNKIHSEELEEKAEWFLSHIYTRSDLASTVEKYRRKMNIDIWNVEEDREHFKAFIYHQMKRMLLNKISG